MVLFTQNFPLAKFRVYRTLAKISEFTVNSPLQPVPSVVVCTALAGHVGQGQVKHWGCPEAGWYSPDEQGIQTVGIPGPLAGWTVPGSQSTHSCVAITSR